MFDFFKSAALLFIVSLQVCGMADENLSQSDRNIFENSKRKISQLSNPGQQIKETAAQKRLRKAAEGTRSILGFLQPRSNTAISQPEIIVAPSVSIRNSKTEKEDASVPTVFSVVSSSFFTEKEVKVPIFPETGDASAQIISSNDGHYWGKFMINAKLKHDVIHYFDDLESAEKWVFYIAKKLKIILEAK